MHDSVSDRAAAERRAVQRRTLRHVPVWAFLAGKPHGVAQPANPDPEAEARSRDEVDELLREPLVAEAMTELQSGRDVVIAPEVRAQLEHLVHTALLADIYAADGYVDPRVESWQRPEGMQS